MDAEGLCCGRGGMFRLSQGLTLSFSGGRRSMVLHILRIVSCCGKDWIRV